MHDCKHLIYILLSVFGFLTAYNFR